MLTLLALASIMLAACGGNEPDSVSPDGTIPSAPATLGLSMQDYYDRLQEAFGRLQAAAENTAPEDLTSTDQLLPFLKDSLSEFSVAMTAFADEVEGLSPPPSMAEAHKAFESALRADAESTADLAEKVGQSASLLEASKALESRNTTLLTSREPCRALQDIALRAAITAELPCDE